MSSEVPTGTASARLSPQPAQEPGEEAPPAFAGVRAAVGGPPRLKADRSRGRLEGP